MKNRKLSTYLVVAVAGLGLAAGSLAFAQNTLHGNGHHGAAAKTQTTQQNFHGGMHGSVVKKDIRAGMHDQAVKQDAYGEMHGNKAAQHARATQYNSNTHCNSATSTQDKKS